MSYYAIIDLEMCNVSKKRQPKEVFLKNEIIQIGVVLLNEELECVDEFKTYVAPEYGEIDGYILKLTGISNKHVKNAPNFQTAFEKLLAWLPDGVVMVAWSNHDETQIRREMRAKGLDEAAYEKILREWVDSQEMFREKLNAKKAYRLSDALNIANIYYNEGAHDALVDAKNTALLFQKMKREVVMTLSPFFVNTGANTYHASVSLGALLSAAAY